MKVRQLGLILLGAFITTQAAAQMKLPTLEEAQELSAKTGRPIFAMAGQET